MLVSKYLELLSMLDNDMFVTEALQQTMRKRMKGMQNDLVESAGEGLLKQYKKKRTEIRKIFAPLPTDFSTMKSGKQLYDIYEGYIIDCFINSKVRWPLYYILYELHNELIQIILLRNHSLIGTTQRTY